MVHKLKNSLEFKLAPPIRPPSTSGWANISAALLGVTLPPYRILIFSPIQGDT